MYFNMHIWGYGNMWIGGFGEMITKPINDMLYYTLSFIKSLSLTITTIISKFYLWINLCITMWISVFFCVKIQGIRVLW